MRNRRRATRLGAIEREILEELSFGDMLVGFLCSARSTRRMYTIASERAKHRYRTQRAFDRLAAQGFIRREGEYATISGTGRLLLGQTIADVRKKLDDKKWDGKWRIVTFDIPERFRSYRNQIRAILKRAGFIKLQQSTWIFPHECEELTKLIKENTRIARHVLYGVLERIENGASLRRAFKLT